MKKVVWSETRLRGPSKFDGKLAAPPRVNGPFQGISIVDLPSSPMVGGAPGIPRPPQAEVPPDPTLYADTVVLALMPGSGDSIQALNPLFIVIFIGGTLLYRNLKAVAVKADGTR